MTADSASEPLSRQQAVAALTGVLAEMFDGEHSYEDADDIITRLDAQPDAKAALAAWLLPGIDDDYERSTRDLETLLAFHERTPEGPDDYCMGCGQLWPCSFEQGRLAAPSSVTTQACYEHVFVDKVRLGDRDECGDCGHPYRSACHGRWPANQPQTEDGAPLSEASDTPEGRCRCGRESYRPDRMEGRRQAARCSACHVVVGRCECPVLDLRAALSTLLDLLAVAEMLRAHPGSTVASVVDVAR